MNYAQAVSEFWEFEQSYEERRKSLLALAKSPWHPPSVVRTAYHDMMLSYHAALTAGNRAARYDDCTLSEELEQRHARDAVLAAIATDVS